MSDFLERLSEVSNIGPAEISNYAELLRENIELKGQRKELIAHVKRNEELLFKAQTIIAGLREEMSFKSLALSFY